MNKKSAGIALAIVALMGIGLVAATPFVPFLNLSDEEKEEWQGHRNSIKEAIENEDFDSWKSLMEERLTEEHFQKIVEGHKNRAEFKSALVEARESGDFTKVQELKEQYGFQGKGYRMHRN